LALKTFNISNILKSHSLSLAALINLIFLIMTEFTRIKYFTAGASTWPRLYKYITLSLIMRAFMFDNLVIKNCWWLIRMELIFYLYSTIDVILVIKFMNSWIRNLINYFWW
jgi:hypothetical protein